jgi:hypothetical protein
MFARLSPKLRTEVHKLLGMVPGLKVGVRALFRLFFFRLCCHS